MSADSTKLIECSSFLEFAANANRIQSRREICDHLLLTVMGRFAISRGEIILSDGSRYSRGPDSGNDFPYRFPLTFAEQKLGEFFLGKRLVAAPLTKEEKSFIIGLCSLTATFMKNIMGREDLKQANRNLSKKILELNSLFELSRELLLTKDIGKAAALCMNELSGQLLLKEILIAVQNQKSGKYSCYGRNIPIPEGWLTRDEIRSSIMLKHEVNVDGRVFLLTGEKLNRQPFSHSDKAFTHILLNFLVTTIDNILMVEERIVREKLEREILIARDIQQKLLPQTLPELSGIRIQAEMETFGEVGGDYYDAIRLSDTKLFFLMADVTGKGIPASLIMSAVQSSLKTLITTGHHDLIQIAESLNKLISETTETNKFVSMFLGILDTAAQTLAYLNAGHNHPILFNRDSTDIRELSIGGMVLGLFEDAIFESDTVDISPGDTIFLYTDGLTEICDKNGNEFGETALKQLLLNHRSLSCEELVSTAVKEAGRFGNNRLVDDVTAMCIRYQP
ncbi:MAG: serine/threonine-protein phosphatase [Acidobacteria bacterium]|nr:serine/threonine-protein phosphatase [Acidobacteriota bacterium]